MRQLGFLIMASTLPLGITTRKAVQLLPFPHIGTSYRYSTITKLLEAGFMEERHVTVTKDHRPYENTYLSLTCSGLYALAQYAGNHPVAIGRVLPGAVGYDFLRCIDTEDPGQADGVVRYQRQSNAGIAALLRTKEAEAFLQSAGVAVFPFERPDLSCILHRAPKTENTKAPTMIGAIVLSAVQRWLRSHPRQKVAIDRSIPMWFSSRDIKTFVDGPASSHHDFANYDGIILLADRYITFYHAGVRGTAWNAKANKRLLSYLDVVFGKLGSRHLAVMTFETTNQWRFLLTDVHHKRRSNDPTQAIGKPFLSLFLLPLSDLGCAQMRQILRFDLPVSDLCRELCKRNHWNRDYHYDTASGLLIKGQLYYNLYLPTVSTLLHIFDRCRSGDRDFKILCPNDTDFMKHLHLLFPGIKLAYLERDILAADR